MTLEYIPGCRYQTEQQPKSMKWGHRLPAPRSPLKGLAHDFIQACGLFLTTKGQSKLYLSTQSD